MFTLTPDRVRPGSLFGLLVAAVLIAGCGSSSSSSSSAATGSASNAASTSGAVSISTTKGPVGTYLTGASGRALYLWVADTGGRSNCSGQCAKFWPPLLSSTTPRISGTGVSASDLGTITRADGSKQVTYQGHPLYYFREDSAAGTDHGQGSDNFGAKWWLVAPSGAALTKAASSPSSSGGSGYGAGGGSGY